MVYKPVRVHDRELVDGGIVSTTNLDIAVEAGAKFVIVVNPLVPYVNDFTETVSGLLGTRARHVSDMGFPQIGYQAFKLLAYQRLHEMARQWEQRYPGVDIVLIEPEPNDELMFQTSIMNFTSRVEIARHGFESVTLKLAEDYDSCARSASATASRSRPPACARSSSTSRPRRSGRAPGARSSSRRPARCCASRPGTTGLEGRLVAPAPPGRRALAGPLVGAVERLAQPAPRAGPGALPAVLPPAP